MTDKLKNDVRKAVEFAIKEMGMVAFKKCSFFASNEKSASNELKDRK